MSKTEKILQILKKKLSEQNEGKKSFRSLMREYRFNDPGLMGGETVRANALNRLARIKARQNPVSVAPENSTQRMPIDQKNAIARKQMADTGQSTPGLSPSSMNRQNFRSRQNAIVAKRQMPAVSDVDSSAGVGAAADSFKPKPKVTPQVKGGAEVPAPKPVTGQGASRPPANLQTPSIPKPQPKPTPPAPKIPAGMHMRVGNFAGGTGVRSNAVIGGRRKD